MGFTESQSRKFLFFSALISTIFLVTAFVTKLPFFGILGIAALFLVNLLLFWMVQSGTRPGKKILAWMENPFFSQVGFLFGTSLLSSGLGFLSWLFLFDPGSLVREALFGLGPVIAWVAVTAAYWLAASGAVLNAGGEKRDGLLIGAVL